MIRRWAFNFAAATSLLLCILSLLTWRASYSSKAVLNRAGGSTSWELVMSTGETAIVRTRWANPIPSQNLGWTFQTLKATSLLDAPSIGGYAWQVRLRMMGFGVISSHFRIIRDAEQVVWPCWASVLITAFFPSVWFVRRRRYSTMSGCKHCGYNLTGNLSGVCPECGTTIRKVAETNATPT